MINFSKIGVLPYDIANIYVKSSSAIYFREIYPKSSPFTIEHPSE